jgi:hypothetical protein
MSRDTDRTSNVQAGLGDIGRNVSAASWRGPERGRLSILRRWRDASAPLPTVRTCPACAGPIRDLVAARLGFCDRCREFTGMCGAGRKIICPDMATRTTWHTPCTELGAVAWEITQGQQPSRTVLCRVHDAQVRSGGTPWILDAVALDPAASLRPAESAGVHAAVTDRAW